jgi:hypothetical protein
VDWADVRGAGARDAYIAGYSWSADSCSSYVSGSGPVSSPENGDESVLNVVVTFGDSSEAQAAWKAGEFFVAPSRFRSYGEPGQRQSALGDYSATVVSEGVWVGIWANGSNLALLETTHGPLTAAKLAQSVNDRM